MNVLAVPASEEAWRHGFDSTQSNREMPLAATGKYSRWQTQTQGGKDVHWYKHGLWTCTGVLTHAKMSLAKNRHNLLLD